MNPPMYRVTITPRDKLKSTCAFNSATEIKKRDKKVALRVEGIHEIVTPNY